MITEKQIDESINKASRFKSNICAAILAMDGMSTYKNRHLFNNLGSYFENKNYLEVGVWKAATFCSTFYNNKFNSVTAIDNFSLFQDISINQVGITNVKKNATYNINEARRWSSVQSNEIKLIESDAFSVNLKSLPKIDFYFYDGDHEEEAQYKAYTYFNSILADTFFTVIDDWGSNGDLTTAKRGTRRAFEELEYEILYERELPPGKVSQDQNGWWNGLYLAIIKKAKNK